MVMGPTHALSGVTVWMAGAAGLQLCGVSVPTAELAVGAAVSAGAALLPDIDHPSSTIARTFGPVSTAVSHLVDRVSTAVYNMTCTAREAPRTGGHRTLTHTAVFAVAVGGLVSTVCGLLGKPAAVTVLFLTLGLAIRGLMGRWARRQGWVVTTLVTAAAAAAAMWWLPAGRGYPVLGLAVAVGSLTHCLGDMITKQGCPLAWPMVHRGKRWWEFAPPAALRIRAGGSFEKTVLVPALTVFTVAGTAFAIPEVQALILSG
ncbi:metal-dependent hydrolase [Streptomyces sp. NPDC051644]|uniref:metal-dependent hydrolase n=1 Tax=Streptomyces sp. NPDC051644 TaxID=3365666 RepID=UPI00379DBBC2